PPYELAKHKTRSGVKTHTTPQGTPENFNEIRFEDKKGAEELFVQAERAMNVLVKANENRAVGGDHLTTVHGKVGMRTRVTNGNYNVIASKKAALVGKQHAF